MEKLQKALGERLEKAKYTKRTGSPGNYKYEYGEKKGRGKKKVDWKAAEKTADKMQKEKGKKKVDWKAAEKTADKMQKEKGKKKVGDEKKTIKETRKEKSDANQHDMTRQYREKLRDVNKTLNRIKSNMTIDSWGVEKPNYGHIGSLGHIQEILKDLEAFIDNNE